MLSFYISFKNKVNITFKRQQAILHLFILIHLCFWYYNKDKTPHRDIRMDFNCVTPPPQGQRGLPGEQGFRGLPGPGVSDNLPFS